MGHFWAPTRLLCDIINYFYNATLSSMIFYISAAKNRRLWNVFISHRVPEARTPVNFESSRASASRSLNGRWTFHRDDDVSQRQTIAVLGATLRHRRSSMAGERVRHRRHPNTRHLTTLNCHLRSFRFPPTFFVLSDNVNRMKHFSFLFSRAPLDKHTFSFSHVSARDEETLKRLRITNKIFSSQAANEQENRFSFSVSSSASAQALLG